MKKSKRIEVLVVYSDIHAGSHVAVMPPGFRTTKGNEILPTELQKWLWDCWQDCKGWVDQVTGTDPFGLVINGDVTEGIHHGTKEIISNEPTDHINMAGELLAPLAKKAAKTFVVRGTECHTGEHEVSLGKMLGAEVNPETGFKAFDKLLLEVNGTLCAFSHHIGTSLRGYTEATQFSIVINEEMTAAAKRGHAIPRVICRAHRHKHGKYDNGRSLCVVSPAWQGLTRFGHKVVPHERPEPGAYILDWRGLPEGSLPRVHTRLYDAPEPQAICV